MHVRASDDGLSAFFVHWAESQHIPLAPQLLPVQRAGGSELHEVPRVHIMDLCFERVLYGSRRAHGGFGEERWCWGAIVGLEGCWVPGGLLGNIIQLTVLKVTYCLHMKGCMLVLYNNTVGYILTTGALDAEGRGAHYGRTAGVARTYGYTSTPDHIARDSGRKRLNIHDLA